MLVRSTELDLIATWGTISALAVIPSGQSVRLWVRLDWSRLFQRRPGRTVGKRLSKTKAGHCLGDLQASGIWTLTLISKNSVLGIRVRVETRYRSEPLVDFTRNGSAYARGGYGTVGW